MNREETAKRIRGIASRALWFGLIAGALLGFAFGFAVGYGMGSPTNLIVPLSEGIRT